MQRAAPTCKFYKFMMTSRLYFPKTSAFFGKIREVKPILIIHVMVKEDWKNANRLPFFKTCQNKFYALSKWSGSCLRYRCPE